MKGEHGDRWLIALGTMTVLVIAYPEWMVLSHQYHIVLVMIVAVSLFAALFLTRSSLKDDLFQGMAALCVVDRLRREGHLVELGKESLRIPLGSLSAIRLVLDDAGRMTGRYMVDATPNWYGAIIIPIMIWPLTIFNIPVIIHAALRVLRFVGELRYGPTIRTEEGDARDIKTVLISEPCHPFV